MMMLKHSFPIIALLLEWGCNSPSQPAASPENHLSIDTSTHHVSDLCDQINWQEDTLFSSPSAAFKYEPLRGAGGGFSEKIKLKNGFLGVIGVVGDEEGTLAVFQADALQRWTQVYCGPLESAASYDVSMPDLNFDGYKDLLIDANSGGSFGKSSMGFLYDQQRRTFRRNTALDVENLNIDPLNKRLRSRHYSSKYGGICKWLYAWEGDSLVLIGEAVYHAEVDSASISLKTRQKDGSLKTSVIDGKIDDAWKIFDLKCLWKGDFFLD